MILTTVDEAAQYKGISIYLDAAIDWIQEHFNDEFVKGVYSIDCADGTTMAVECSDTAQRHRGHGVVTDKVAQAC